MARTEEQEDEELKARKAWDSLIALCKDIRYGTIEKLTINKGVPVHAEITRRSIKLV